MRSRQPRDSKKLRRMAGAPRGRHAPTAERRCRVLFKPRAAQKRRLVNCWPGALLAHPRPRPERSKGRGAKGDNGWQDRAIERAPADDLPPAYDGIRRAFRSSCTPVRCKYDVEFKPEPARRAAADLKRYPRALDHALRCRPLRPPTDPGPGPARRGGRGDHEGGGTGAPAAGEGAGEANQAGALATPRSSGPERAPGAAAAIGLVGLAGAAGDGAGLASGAGASELGGLSRATASWTSTTWRGVPGTDSADGEGESQLGLLPDPGRAPQAGRQRLGHGNPIAAETLRHPASGSPLEPDLEAVPRRSCEDTGGGRLLHG